MSDQAHASQDYPGLEQQSVFDLTTHLALILTFSIYSLLNVKTNQLSVEQANLFPYYYLSYSVQFLGLSMMCFVICIIQYLRHFQMRKTILKEASLFVQRFKWTTINNNILKTQKCQYKYKYKNALICCIFFCYVNKKDNVYDSKLFDL